MGSVNFLNLNYIFLWMYQFFGSFNLLGILQWVVSILAFIRPFAFLITLLLLIFIAYCMYRIRELSKKEEELYGPPKEEVSTLAPKPHKELNEKWQHVQTLMSSTNSSDWRQAIIEADIMLGDILKGFGYDGNSIGDQLKSVEPGDMKTLNDAWEAHKIRNQIAHDGSDFQLNEREARHTIAQYKKVFEEFFYI